MSSVHYLRPPEPPPDAYSELQRQRTAMISAWTAWLATHPAQSDIHQEITGTTGAMLSLADLLTLAAERRG